MVLLAKNTSCFLVLSKATARLYFVAVALRFFDFNHPFLSYLILACEHFNCGCIISLLIDFSTCQIFVFKPLTLFIQQAFFGRGTE